MVAARKPITLAITTGDTDGVGLEVTLKALNAIGPKANLRFVVFRDHKTPTHLKSLETRVSKKFSGAPVLVFDSATNPAKWVEIAAKKCLKNEWAGLVTGPLSKETIRQSGRSDIGHTDILKRISGVRTLHMGFIGDHFNVVLATGHIPIGSVSHNLTVSALNSALNSAKILRSYLSPTKARKPFGLVGLNPHAGENGLLGSEELTVFKKFLSQPFVKKDRCLGPLVPDAAFLKKNWGNFSVFICSYHDQGLIPFKMIHGHRAGVHVTLNLPFTRVSVDHGTAKDIYKKSIADPGSMIRAIKLAEKLALRRLM